MQLPIVVLVVLTVYTGNGGDDVNDDGVNGDGSGVNGDEVNDDDVNGDGVNGDGGNGDGVHGGNGTSIAMTEVPTSDSHVVSSA